VSTTRSPVIKFDDEEYSMTAQADYRTYEGQLSISHTSDTVAWTVDGKHRWVMSKVEFGALLDSYDAIKEGLK
jgi:hypothetical protein